MQLTLGTSCSVERERESVPRVIMVKDAGMAWVRTAWGKVPTACVHGARQGARPKRQQSSKRQRQQGFVQRPRQKDSTLHGPTDLSGQPERSVHRLPRTEDRQHSPSGLAPATRHTQNDRGYGQGSKGGMRRAAWRHVRQAGSTTTPPTAKDRRDNPLCIANHRPPAAGVAHSAWDRMEGERRAGMAKERGSL